MPAILALFMGSCSREPGQSELSIPFEKYTLPNGLTVILTEDRSDPIVSVAVYYHVGSSREEPGKTGFAHLFEHMMFQRSENVGEDELFRNIQAAGGSLNGSTSQDRTNYYQVVPKNALEMVLWMESDRMGYLENTVTQTAFINQQNVVMNEKRQSYDNAPYGFTSEVILKNLFPKGHPYSWTVIGEMKDLVNATVEDVKAFHRKFYIPSNAYLAITGDIEKEEVKTLVEKYFGEIPAGEAVEEREPIPVSLPSTVRLFHEDNFARAPQLNMVFPTVERYSKDSYALYFLGNLLANTKKAPLYTVLVKDKKLTSRVQAGNSAQELSGYFMISVTANPGTNLTEVEKAIFEGLEKFEAEGFTEEDITRIKAGYETSFYNRLASVQGKAFTLAEYAMYTGDPGFYKNDLANIKAVTSDDIWEVYNKYIKDGNYVQTSFVPKGQTELAVEGSVDARVVEEDISNAAEVLLTDVVEEPIVKTPAKFDRSLKPPVGPDPEVKIPLPWTDTLSNGIKLWGITQSELPLVQYSLIIKGGHVLDDMNKAGLASLVATMLNEGTRNKTPEELEDAIGLLGASIRFSADNEDISVNVSTLSRNYEKTVELVREMLLEPRWDEEQFELAKSRVINTLKRNEADPDYLAERTINKLIFGDNILAVDVSGTEETVSSITIDDLKDYYERYFSPSVSRFLIVGDVDQKRVETSLKDLAVMWQPKEVVFPEFNLPGPPEKPELYFVDVPGAKQSVIAIGTPSLSRTNPDFYPAYVANYKLGGSFNGILNLILREEKGYTYGARSGITGSDFYGSFIASSSVSTNATLESVSIFRDEMAKYRKDMPQEYIDFTKSALIKSNALRFETLNNLLSMLGTMTAYNLPYDYIKQEEAYVNELTTDKQLEMVRKYIDPERMYYVVAGDAASQMGKLEKAGLGKPVLVKN